MAFARALHRVADSFALLHRQLDRVVRVAESLERIANAMDELVVMEAHREAFYLHGKECPKLWRARGEMAASILRERGIKLPEEAPAP